MRASGVLLAAVCVILAIGVTRMEPGLVKDLCAIVLAASALMLIGGALMRMPR
jgi:hypothetical protein